MPKPELDRSDEEKDGWLFSVSQPDICDLDPKLKRLVGTYQTAYYAPDPSLMLLTLATYAAFKLPGEPPLWPMIVGGPSGGKTSTMDALRLLPDVRFRSTVTAPGLLSASSKENHTRQSTGGLLKEVGEAGLLALKDFTSMLSMSRDQMREVMAALREIYDGSWSRAVGADGGKTVSWKGKLVVIAACTSIFDEHSNALSALGERFLVYRMTALNSAEQERMAATAVRNSNHIEGCRQQLAEQVRDFLAEFDAPLCMPELEPETSSFLEAYSTFVARSRSAVTRHPNSREIENVHAPEDPARLAGQLRRLEAGLSVIGVPKQWRHRIVRKSALDCIPPVRRRALEVLAREERPVDLAMLAAATRHPRTTTWRALDDLRAHEVVEFNGHRSGTAAKPEADGSWGLSEEWRERWMRFPKSGKA